MSKRSIVAVLLMAVALFFVSQEFFRQSSRDQFKHWEEYREDIKQHPEKLGTNIITYSAGRPDWENAIDINEMIVKGMGENASTLAIITSVLISGVFAAVLAYVDSGNRRTKTKKAANSGIDDPEQLPPAHSS